MKSVAQLCALVAKGALAGMKATEVEHLLRKAVQDLTDTLRRDHLLRASGYRENVPVRKQAAAARRAARLLERAARAVGSSVASLSTEAKLRLSGRADAVELAVALIARLKKNPSTRARLHHGLPKRVLAGIFENGGALEEVARFLDARVPTERRAHVRTQVLKVLLQTSSDEISAHARDAGEAAFLRELWSSEPDHTGLWPLRGRDRENVASVVKHALAGLIVSWRSASGCGCVFCASPDWASLADDEVLARLAEYGVCVEKSEEMLAECERRAESRLAARDSAAGSGSATRPVGATLRGRSATRRRTH